MLGPCHISQGVVANILQPCDGTYICTLPLQFRGTQSVDTYSLFSFYLTYPVMNRFRPIYLGSFVVSVPRKTLMCVMYCLSLLFLKREVPGPHEGPGYRNSSLFSFNTTQYSISLYAIKSIVPLRVIMVAECCMRWLQVVPILTFQQ